MKHIPKSITTEEPAADKHLEEEKQQKERRDLKTLVLVCGLMSLCSTFMSIVNVYKHSDLLFSTIFGAVLFLTAAAAVAVIFSWYAVTGETTALPSSGFSWSRASLCWRADFGRASLYPYISPCF